MSNFSALEVVDRGSETQLQVDETLNYGIQFSAFTGGRSALYDVPAVQL